MEREDLLPEDPTALLFSEPGRARAAIAPMVFLEGRYTGMKTRRLILIGAFLSILPQIQVQAQDESKAPGAKPSTGPSVDEEGIRATLNAIVQAFRKGEAQAVAERFAEDGEAVDGQGTAIQGRAAIEEHYAARLEAAPDEKLEATIESITNLAPGIARVEGRTLTKPAEEGPPTSGRFTAVVVKKNDNWLVASLRELTDAQVSPHEHLKELEWLVGDWVEEAEDAVVFTSVAWADNKNFLLRSFDVRVEGKPALSGTQRIGWDPLSRQLKSWVFDSNGGHGEGLWMRSGNHWIIKATGVRADGRTTTATQVLTYNSNDSLSWKSIDRTVGAEINSDIDEIRMVRKPPQPK